MYQSYSRHRLASGRGFVVAATIGLLAISAVTVATNGRAQVPTNPDYGFRLVLYERESPVGLVYRDVAGSTYIEHWVLYPNFTFDRTQRAGSELHIVAEARRGYSSVEDYLDRVPFPEGSRYVVAACREFDSLPANK